LSDEAGDDRLILTSFSLLRLLLMLGRSFLPHFHLLIR
jgi:hypothetical protein